MDKSKVTDEQLKDLVGFSKWCLDNQKEDMLLTTLLHDLGGLYREESCFLPKSSGYGKHVA